MEMTGPPSNRFSDFITRRCYCLPFLVASLIWVLLACRLYMQDLLLSWRVGRPVQLPIYIIGNSRKLERAIKYRS